MKSTPDLKFWAGLRYYRTEQAHIDIDTKGSGRLSNSPPRTMAF